MVSGGSTRPQSVYNALSMVPNDCEIICIHDAARPFISKDTIKKCINSAKKGINCIAAVPVKSTIKKINSKTLHIKDTPLRSRLWQAQTPQVFRRKDLVRAYKKLGKRAFKCTDDAMLLEKCGMKVRVVQDSYTNIKITTKDDLVIAEAMNSYL